MFFRRVLAVVVLAQVAFGGSGGMVLSVVT